MKLGIGTMLLTWDLFKNTKFKDIDEEAAFPVRIVVTGDDPIDTAHILGTLDETSAAGIISRYGDNPNITVNVRREAGATMVDMTTEDPEVGETVLLTDFDHENIVTTLGPVLIELMPDLNLALGRRVPVLRPLIAQKLIRSTSTENAQIAALTNLADLVPVVGPIIGSAADLIVLTRNQVMMVYRLALLHGKSIGSTGRLISEVIPVLGLGFLWRTIARSLVGMMPLGLGIVPKIAMAFAGTYAVGQAASYFYTTGRKPPKVILNDIALDATAQWKRLRPGDINASVVTPEKQVPLLKS